MDKLRAMEVFVGVVETGAVTRAADRLGVPKATATTLLQRLERELGVKLLNRTTRRVSVTADGRAYYERCLAILESVRESEETLRSKTAQPRGKLRADMPTLIARTVVIPALSGFVERYPDIELALASNERRADLVEEGIDCAVWSGAVEDPNLVSRRVGFLYLAICAAPSYLASHEAPRHPDDLKNHCIINHFTPRTGKVSDWTFSRNGVRLEATPSSRIMLEDENSYLSAAEAGLGIARIPAFVLKSAMERRTLDLVMADWIPEPVPLHVVYPQNRHLSAKLRAFVDWIADLLANHDGIQLRSTLPHAHGGRNLAGDV